MERSRNYTKWGKSIIAGGLTAAMLLSGMGGIQMAGKTTGKVAKAAQTEATELVIDGSTANTAAQTAYRGLGTVTCNNSSRLLLDYKEDHPEEYWEIMNWLFSKKNGAGLSHVKIELGCDSNTSSGAEPATKRTAEEKADVNRGAGFVFAYDALSINPDITVDMLCWGMPSWVKKAYQKSEKSGYKARYRWYKETVDAAYDVWGIKFSYISANANEKSVEEDWTIYLAEALEKETAERYDYGQIKLVAADETDTMDVAVRMLKNKKYRDVVDVIGCHYNSYMDKNVLKLNKEYGKEIWFSEGASVATDSVFGNNNTTDKVSTSGTNGMLDIANRIIIGYAQSNMTLYEFQPSVAAYYDGAVYFPKQLLAANHPWSGYYQVTTGLVMAMHFNQFIDKGWQYITSGSYGDGTQSDHFITKTKNDYLTAADTSTGNYSTVITNDSAAARTYQVKVSNLAAAGSPVAVWETRSNTAGESYDAGWFNLVNTINPTSENGVYTYTVTVSPYSMITLTTTTGQKSYAQMRDKTHANQEAQNTTLSLPYTDNFEYTEEFLTRRSGTPKYTTDQDGAFEVVKLQDGSKVLMQKISRDIIPAAWGGENNNPVTSLGDDTWKDYSVSADVMLDDTSDKMSDYVGICARYNCSEGIADNGYWLKVYRDGKWKLCANTGVLASGKKKEIQGGRWMTLKVTVLENKITASINGQQVANKTVSKSLTNSGRIALGSSYANNCYDNIQVRPVLNGSTNIKRIDDLDDKVTVSEGVTREHSQSYVNYGRTITNLKKKGDKVSCTFTGTGISLLGKNYTRVKLNISVDGQVLQQGYALKDTDNRAVFYQVKNMSEGQHTIELTLAGKEGLSLDALEVQGTTWQDTGAKATGITLGATQAAIGYGQSIDLKPVLQGENPTDVIEYRTSDASVAVITSDGVLHGNGGGKAIVTATTESGSSAICEVSVTELKISPATVLVAGIGEKISMKASCAQKKSEVNSIKWISDDTNIAGVSQKGLIKAKKDGKTVITAQTESGLKRSITITVKKAPTKIKCKKKMTLKTGKTKQMKYTLSAGSTSRIVKYRSSKPKVASITKAGLIRAKKPGKSLISVVTYNGKKAKLKLTVKR